MEEEYDYRHNGTQLDNHQKSAVERFRHIKRQKGLEKHHMAGRGNGQPFGNALDDAKQTRLEGFDDIHIR